MVVATFGASFVNPWFIALCIATLAVFVWQGEKEYKTSQDYDDLRVALLDMGQAHDGTVANLNAEIEGLKKELKSVNNKVGSLYMGGTR